jgi:hypothetical protein
LATSCSEEGHAAFVGGRWSALALAALEQIQPDLVVMDDSSGSRTW